MVDSHILACWGVDGTIKAWKMDRHLLAARGGGYWLPTGCRPCLFLSHSLGVSVCTNSSFWDKFKWNCWKHAWVMRASVCTGKNLKQQSNSRVRKRQTIQTCWNLVLLSYWLFEMHSTCRSYFVIFLIVIPISLSWFSPGGLNEPQTSGEGALKFHAQSADPRRSR